MPKRLIIGLAAVSALLFFVSIFLGSSGETEGDPDTGQKIANVLFPISVLLALVLIGIIVVSSVSPSAPGRSAMTRYSESTRRRLVRWAGSSAPSGRWFSSVAGCGDDDSSAGRAAAEAAPYCEFAAELDAMQTQPTEEQLDRIVSVAPADNRIRRRHIRRGGDDR